MAFTTESNYTGDGSEKDFLVTFPFLAEADIKVRTQPSGGSWTTHTVTTDYTLNNNIVTFGTAPANNAAVQIFRDTNIDKTNSTFQTGASIRAQDLNNLAKQFLYAAQEFEQASTTPSGTGLALTTGTKNKIIVNSANDWTLAPGAIPAASINDDSIDSNHYVNLSIDREHLSNDIIDSTKLADDSVNSEHYIDGSIDTAHIGDEQVTRDKLPAALQYGFTVVGTVIWYAGSTAPTGYVKCNGDSVPNGSGTIQGVTTDYSALYAVVGANLPDLRGEFVRGFDDGKGTDSGRTIRSTQAEEYKQHTHTPTISTTTSLSGSMTNISENWQGDGSASGFITKTTGTTGTHTPEHTDHSDTAGASIDANHTHTVTIGNSGGDETRPRNVALLACIKY